MTPAFPYSKILIPLDFSDASQQALEHGLALARLGGATVYLLTVIDTSFPYPDLYSLEDPTHDYFMVMRDRALARMDESLAAAGADGVPIEKLIGRGRPRVEIPAMARDVGASVVVISSHGGGGLRGALLGSTTDAVLRDAPCPVLVLRPVPGTGPMPV